MSVDRSKEDLLEEISRLKQIIKAKNCRIEEIENSCELTQIFNTVANGIRIIDKDFNNVRVNKTFTQMTGLEESEVKNKKCYDVFKSHCCHTPNCSLVRILKGETLIECEIRKQLKDGKTIDCLLTAKPLYDIDGDIIGIVEDFRDISSVKNSEQALRESEIQHNLILQGISDLVILYGVESETDFRVLKVNESCLRVLRLEEKQVRGKLIQEVLPAEVANQLIENDIEAVRARKPILAKEVSYPFGCFETNSIPIINEDGKCTHLLVTARDISVRKQMEEHVLKIEKLESVGLLAGGIAHDFNNILTVITGNISLTKLKLSKQEENLQILDLLNEVEKASWQARNLTQQLLTFAKGGAPVLKTSSIEEVLKESVGFALSGSNVRCDFNSAETLWPVDIDEGQISQVINNLIINADHAMPEGGIVKVKVENFMVTGEQSIPLERGNYVKISIADHGIGIPQEYLNKVFDPYFTTKQKGNGLGLSTAYSIVRKHNGCLLVESKLGEGTIFYIYLPASKNDITANERSRHSFSRGSGRVLVMDDEKMICMVLKDMLNHMGYEVKCVKNGQEALKEYKHCQEQNNPFDLVIMDLTIPGGMGGKETIGELLTLDPQVKAIVASGYSNDTVMSNYKDYGFKGIIIKPFDLKELNEVITNVLDKKIASQSA